MIVKRATEVNVQDKVNQEDSEQNEVDGVKNELIPQVSWCISERAVGDGRTRVTYYLRCLEFINCILILITINYCTHNTSNVLYRVQADISDNSS